MVLPVNSGNISLSCTIYSQLSVLASGILCVCVYIYELHTIFAIPHRRGVFSASLCSLFDSRQVLASGRMSGPSLPFPTYAE